MEKLKIIALQAENIKKLVAVEIKPDGNLVQITGKNGQGKTSVLDCIWWALGGLSGVQAAPIRQGQTEAKIKLDMGEVVVTRKFKADEDGEITSSLTVENASGARFPSPQAMLDGLLGALSFDPLAFARMEPAQKFNQLRLFVPDVDFNAIDMANKADYQARTDLNRRAKEARVQADKIVVTASAGTQPVDEAALVNELEQAGAHNAQIETRKANRVKFADDAKAKRTEIAGKDALIGEKKKSIAALEKEIETLRGEIQALDKSATELEVKLQGAPALPEPIDTAVVKAKIEKAKETNAAIAKIAEKDALISAAKNLEAQSEELTKKMEERERNKQAKIAAAKLPVAGISFVDGGILMNGVPFEQASDAEQLRASIAIAMALNPKLRVIRVRDGSLLDEGSMEILAQMAKDQDYQVWVERVDSSGKVGFVLENGHVKQEVK